MKAVVGISAGLMVIATMISVGYVGYRVGFADGESHAQEYSIVKTPLQCGITKSYVAERLENAPDHWWTPDDLGIVLIKGDQPDSCGIYIARKHEEKAMAWMRDEAFTPQAIKYEDEFLGISYLWVTPGLSESMGLLLVQISAILGLGWAAVLLISRSSTQKSSAVRV
jgi:hypothetical protein